MHIASISIDLGKTTFHLVVLGGRNKVLFRRNSHARSCWSTLRTCPRRSSVLKAAPGRTLWEPHCEQKVTRCD